MSKDNSNKYAIPLEASAAARSEESHGFPRIDRHVVLAASVRRSGLRWLTALLDSHPRSVCRSEPFERAYSLNLESVLRRLHRTGTLSATDRERLIDEWTNVSMQQPASLFFSKHFTPTGPWRQWWSWTRARWADKARSAYVAAAAPACDQPYDLVLTQTTNLERVASAAKGLEARLFILRRHPGAVVASQLRGLRQGRLPPLDRVGWYEENPRACRELELRLSSILRMPIAELLAYQWLVQNMQFRSALAHLPCASLAMQFEDFCHDPDARARQLFAFLGWEFGPQTQAFIRQSTRGGWHSLHGWLAGRRRYATVFRRADNICEAWRNELTDYEQRRILNIARAFPHFNRYWPE